MKEEEYYFPSNGTDGDYFMNEWCVNCRKDTMLRGGQTYCSILTGSMVSDSHRVKQWIYKNGVPTCTSFIDYRNYKVSHKRKIKNQFILEL